MSIEDVLEFVKKHDLMMLATVDDNGKPEAAVVEFGEKDDFTIVIDTLTTSRKYKNLQSCNNVAVVVGWDNSVTVQFEGSATELLGPALEAAKQAYFAKNPRAKKWADRPDVAYFAIKPNWIRYSDLNQDPWLIEEFSL
ncbi:pyridoxamine 5'-phosphate oxidase family protein [Candidatus Saccharibacteria bacterium]|nr:pyridoxamine 5'-phosphate oxidase family protein [Candidatus Saccharibacteria bacterium]